MTDPSRRAGPYELFALLLSVFALLLLGVAASVELDPESQRIIDLGDLVICVFFLADFVANLVRAPNRWRYLYTWGWLDLAASIPAVDALRYGRVGRIIRILRVLRIVKASHMLTLALTRRRESAVWGALLVSLVVVFAASIGVLQFERVDGNIKNAEDAVWWSITTITSVGYGDRYPVTTEGRLVAVVLMIVGLGLIGTLSGAAASWFIQPVHASPDDGRQPSPGSRT